MSQPPYPPHQQPGYQQHPQQRQYTQQQYAPQQQYAQQLPYQQQAYPPPAPAPKRRRRVWPWVLLAVVMVPIIGFVGCTALLAGGVAAVDEARKGGSVPLGETFTYQSGLALNVAIPKPYRPDNQFELQRDEVGYETTIAITNGTDKPVGAILITRNATLNGQPAPELFGDGTLATQDIAPGQSLALPFRFKTADGARGPLQIAVTDTFNEPVFFNGNIG
ncbi:hypothetical protein ACQPWY_15215 [Pseudonocardia xinjiangensis]|uniref:hypothetical protein n=1 Tax=Pseudonocardia xinjiangensis TaxID=75289 RepID=UPI003D8C357A